MNELVEAARDHITRRVDDLEGDDDFMPFMLVNGPTDRVYVGIDMPRFGSPRDDIADVMMALVVTHEGTEAVFASMAWTLRDITAEERKQWGNRDFGEHPNRVETVFMVYAGPDDRDEFHSAPVTRENNMVRLGVWVSPDAFDYRMGGRFSNAMHAGIGLARNMPAEMVEFTRQQVAAGNERDVMKHLIRAYRRVRTGQITDEEIAEGKRLAEQMGIQEDGL
jgi:hypothetical protein